MTPQVGHSTIVAKPFKRRLTHVGQAILKKLIPLGLRRAFFVASLMAHIKDLHSPDKELAKRVSNLMDLGCDPSSLLFPMQMSHNVWKNLPASSVDLSGNTRINSQQLHEFCTEVITYTPEWLHYNTRRAMREDVYKLLSVMAPSVSRAAI